VIPISDMAGRRRSFPIVNVLLILANIYVFVAYELMAPSESALNRLIQAAGVVPMELLSGRDLPPLAPLGNIYLTLFTSMFLHGSLLHLGGNMLFLWVFGDNVEDSMGHLPYLAFYLICGVVAGLAQSLINAASTVPSIGASGAIAGVLAGYLLRFPHAQVRTLIFLGPFIIFPRISANIQICFWFVLQVFSGVASIGVQTEQTSGVAFWAHVGGFIAGLVLIKVFPHRAPSALDLVR
jgi:membrane associated rhomboid family serine protease